MFLTELVPSAIVASAVAPALLLLWLVVTADSRPEPPRVVWIAFILGALSVIPTGFLEEWLQHIPFSDNPWLSTLPFVGVPEESVKISIIAAIALRARDFDEPMDGVVYGTAVGLGFAVLENLLYVMGAGSDWGITAIIRGFLSVPFHGALGAIAGSYIARIRFSGVLAGHNRSPWHRPRLLLSAWLIPVVLHSLFDASLLSIPADTDTDAGANAALMLMVMAGVVGFATIVFAALLARRVARRQKRWIQTKRLPPAHWRNVWAQCLFGVGLSFVALTLAISGSSVVKFVGWVLFYFAVRMARKCGKYLKEAAQSRRDPAAIPLSMAP